MNGFKKLCAAVLALLILGSVCACHKKDEVAVTIKDEKFTSADYLYYLINANMEAMTKVNDSLTEEEKAAQDFDVYSKKIDGKSFEDWVKDTALENLEKSAAYVLLCKENGVEVDKQKISDAQSTADMIWTYYGYDQEKTSLFMINGVYKETFKKCYVNALYQEEYFDHLYGESGTKAISTDNLKKELSENFVLVNCLTVDTQEKTDEEKAETKTRLEGYVKALQDGSKTFEEIYHAETPAENATAEEQTGETKEEDEHSHATLVTTEEIYEKYYTNSQTCTTADYYETAKGMANGEVKLIEKEDGTGYYLLVKKDVLAEGDYLTDNDTILRHIIADEEFDKTVDDYVKGLKVEINHKAIDRFKVKKLKTGQEE